MSDDSESSENESSEQGSEEKSMSSESAVSDDSSEDTTLEQRVARHQKASTESEDPNARGVNSYQAEQFGTYTPRSKARDRRNARNKSSETKAYDDALGYLELAEQETSLIEKGHYIRMAASCLTGVRNGDEKTSGLVDKINDAKEGLVESYKSRAEAQVRFGNYSGASLIAEMARSMADDIGYSISEWHEGLLEKVSNLPGTTAKYVPMGELQRQRDIEHRADYPTSRVPRKGSMYEKDAALQKFHYPDQNDLTKYFGYSGIFDVDTFYPGNGSLRK